MFTGSDVGADQSVTITRTRFDPPEVAVRVGETVTWRHMDDLGHSVTADDGSFDSHPSCGAIGGACMGPGETFTHAFPRPGLFRYHCRIHGAPGGRGMAGKVVVEGELDCHRARNRAIDRLRREALLTPGPQPDTG